MYYIWNEGVTDSHSMRVGPSLIPGSSSTFIIPDNVENSGFMYNKRLSVVLDAYNSIQFSKNLKSFREFDTFRYNENTVLCKARRSKINRSVVKQFSAVQVLE